MSSGSDRGGEGGGAGVCITPLRDCFEGAVPSVLATSSPDGEPNVTYLSQVQYVDERHVALTFQFFNKTRRNILAHPWAVLKVVDPFSGAGWRLQVRYLRTETAGPLFESMKAKLAGIAAHTGMADVFRLLGADVYEVLGVAPVPVPGAAPAVAAPASQRLPRLRRALARLDASRDLDELLEHTLAVLHEEFGIEHQMILKLDEGGERLFTVASRGYAHSGVGSEIPLGQGVIGIAARERTPIRISHMTGELLYGKAVRDSAAALGLHHRLETAIAMPGLAECRSQLAVPIMAGCQLYGVLHVESPEDLRFTYDDEDLLQVLAQQFGWIARALAAQAACDGGAEPPPGPALAPAAAGKPLQVRYFRADHSVFLDDDYLIKGLAGAILWKLLGTLQSEGREHFTNRELRLDPALALPEVADNLEARLVLLQRRLAERSPSVRMRKTGRGRFALEVSRPLRLVAVE